MTWRINPPTSPAVAATGIESHSWCTNAGRLMIDPPSGPTTRPPSNPSRNDPSSIKSAARYGCPKMRRITPNASGGVTKSISFNFWSESRSSVKSTLRKVAERASHAQIDAAAPDVEQKREQQISAESKRFHGALPAAATLANHRADVKRRLRPSPDIIRGLHATQNKTTSTRFAQRDE